MHFQDLNKMRNPWKTIQKRVLYENKYGYKFRDDIILTPKGTESRYMVLEGRGHVVMVPLTPERNILMTRQWRYPIEEESVELPSGTIQLPTESPLATAKKEMLEEVHATSEEWIELGKYWPLNGIVKNMGYLYLALNVKKVDFSHDEDDEEIQIEEIPFDQVMKMVMNGDILDERTQLGLFFVKQYLDNN